MAGAIDMIFMQLKSASRRESLRLSVRYNLRHTDCSAGLRKWDSIVPLPNPGLLVRSTEKGRLAMETFRTDGALAFVCNMCERDVWLGRERLEELLGMGLLNNPPGPDDLGFEGWKKAKDLLDAGG